MDRRMIQQMMGRQSGGFNLNMMRGMYGDMGDGFRESSKIFIDNKNSNYYVIRDDLDSEGEDSKDTKVKK